MDSNDNIEKCPLCNSESEKDFGQWCDLNLLHCTVCKLLFFQRKNSNLANQYWNPKDNMAQKPIFRIIKDPKMAFKKIKKEINR